MQSHTLQLLIRMPFQNPLQEAQLLVSDTAFVAGCGCVLRHGRAWARAVCRRVARNAYVMHTVSTPYLNLSCARRTGNAALPAAAHYGGGRLRGRRAGRVRIRGLEPHAARAAAAGAAARGRRGRLRVRQAQRAHRALCVHRLRARGQALSDREAACFACVRLFAVCALSAAWLGGAVTMLRLLAPCFSLQRGLCFLVQAGLLWCYAGSCLLWRCGTAVVRVASGWRVYAWVFVKLGEDICQGGHTSPAKRIFTCRLPLIVSSHMKSCLTQPKRQMPGENNRPPHG